MSILITAFGLFLLYMAERLIYRKYWRQGLSASLSYTHSAVVEGSDNALVEVVTNDKPLPMPGVSVKFQTSRDLTFSNMENAAVTDQYYRSDIFSLGGREKITRTLPIACTHRGYYTITQAAIGTNDLFYRDKYSMFAPVFTQLYVYPRYVDIRRLLIPFNQLYGEILSRRRFYEDPFEFRSIREYQPQDPLKNVNWKAFARTDQLMVNTFEDTSSQEVHIWLNLENHGYVNHYDIQEENIRLAATLSDMLVTKGIPVAITTNGLDVTSREPIHVPAGTGPGHQVTVLQSLSRIDLKQPVTHMAPRLAEVMASESMAPFVILISNYCQDDWMACVRDLLASDTDLQFIYTYHKDMRDDLDASGALASRTTWWEVEHTD